MSAETDQVIRLAQRLIRAEADRLPTVEVGRDHYGDHPDVSGLLRAAEVIDALIDTEVSS